MGNVSPTLTATDFHDNLRAGGLGGVAPGFPADTAETVAEAICETIENGDAERVLGGQPATS